MPCDPLPNVVRDAVDVAYDPCLNVITLSILSLTPRGKVVPVGVLLMAKIRETSADFTFRCRVFVARLAPLEEKRLG
jgi:hypothetical protein